MKVNDIYSTSVMLVTGAKDESEYKDIAVPLFNLVLSKCFNENNHLRRFKEKDALKEIPTVGSLNDEIPYEDEFATALKYGLAAELHIADADMDDGKHSIYLQMFANEVNKWAMKAVEESVVDVYAEY